jgi:carboxylate-amine ligase
MLGKQVNGTASYRETSDDRNGSVLWPADPSNVVEACRRAFSNSGSFTVGLEEELILLDPATLLPTNEVEAALVRLVDERFTCELRSAQLEVRTRPAVTVAAACRELREARMLAVDRLRGLAAVLAAGVHPTSTLPIEVTHRDRYLGIAADYPWAVREGLPCGLHVHVAIGGPARALAVYNAARSSLPEIAALAANSPFLGGRDTGLASSRLKLNEAFPRAGIPPAFRSWAEYADFVSWGTSGGLFPDQSYLWWDLRLHPVYGTLEFRIADAQTRMGEAGAVAAVCQALVASLAARYDACGDLPVHATHRINENRFRAVRDGLDATFADLDTGIPVPARVRVSALLASLEPFAERFAARNELLAAWTLLAENGAERQRRIVADQGIDLVNQRLAEETEGQPRADLGSLTRRAIAGGARALGAWALS